MLRCHTAGAGAIHTISIAIATNATSVTRALIVTSPPSRHATAGPLSSLITISTSSLSTSTSSSSPNAAVFTRENNGAFQRYRAERQKLVEKRPALLRLDCMNPPVALAHMLVPLPPPPPPPSSSSSPTSATPTLDEVYALWSHATGITIDTHHRVTSIGVRDVLASLFQHIKHIHDHHDGTHGGVSLPTIIIPSDVYPVYSQLVGHASLPYETIDTLPSLNLSLTLSRPLLQSSCAVLLLPSPISPHGRMFTRHELQLLYDWVTCANTDRILVLDAVYSFDYTWNNNNTNNSSNNNNNDIARLWSQLIASDRVMVCYSLSKGWLSPLSYGIAHVPSSLTIGIRQYVHTPNAEQLRVAHHRLTSQPLLPRQLQQRFTAQWSRVAPRLRSLVHGAWSPPLHGYFAIYPRSFETLLHAQPMAIRDWNRNNRDGHGSESGILAVPTNVFGSSHAECSIISCLHDIAHDDKHANNPAPSTTSATIVTASPVPTNATLPSSSSTSDNVSHMPDISSLSCEYLYHVLPMSNFIRGFDKYSRRYSKSSIPESKHKGTFFVLPRHDIITGLNKTRALLHKLAIPDNEILIIATPLIDQHEAYISLPDRRGLQLHRDWIHVHHVYTITNDNNNPRTNDTNNVNANAPMVTRVTIEHACARSLALLSTSARVRPYTDIVPRSVSVLPIAIGCQARCPFCFSHSSVSVDQPSQRALSTERIEEVLIAARAAGAQRAVITGGGEPAMLPHHQLLSLITQCNGHYPGRVIMITNGYAISHLPTNDARDKRMLQLATAGLSVLSVSHHGYDEASNRAIMNLSTGSDDVASSWNRLRHSSNSSIAMTMKSLTLRWVCVLQKTGVHDRATLMAYLDWVVTTQVHEICFKELYVSTSEESVYHDARTNKYSRDNQVSLQLIVDFLTNNHHDNNGNGNEWRHISSLPWGAPIYEGLWRGHRLRIAAYTEPSVYWERHHGVARSWNLLADGTTYASLEDHTSIVCPSVIDDEIKAAHDNALARAAKAQRRLRVINKQHASARIRAAV